MIECILLSNFYVFMTKVLNFGGLNDCNNGQINKIASLRVAVEGELRFVICIYEAINACNRISLSDSPAIEI